MQEDGATNHLDYTEDDFDQSTREITHDAVRVSGAESTCVWLDEDVGRLPNCILDV